MLFSPNPILLSSFILLTIHSCTAIGQPQCFPWGAPSPSDCAYILAHMPSLPPFPSLSSPDSLQSTSHPFFPQAVFHHRSCVFDLEYLYYDRTSPPWIRRLAISKQTMAQTWHDQKAGCGAVVQECCDGSRSGLLREVTGDDVERDTRIHVQVGNESLRTAFAAQMQRMTYRGLWLQGTPMMPDVFHKPIYEL